MFKPGFSFISYNGSLSFGVYGDKCFLPLGAQKLTHMFEKSLDTAVDMVLKEMKD
jgi:hypothetical protein